jgi:glutamine synthetase
MPFIAPYVNSYRRYVAQYSAPINLQWDYDNRTTGIRVPTSSPEARRVENRIAGMDCNPYLGIAASLACGYLGMKNAVKPTKQNRGEAYEAAHDIPKSLNAALNLLNDCPELQEVMGPEFSAAYMAVKHVENDEFQQVISPWEREHLLMNV